MEIGKGWHEWSVSLKYVTKALTILKESGVKEYFILPVIREEDRVTPIHCYTLFYYNEK